MDAALLVEEESVRVDALDHTNASSPDLSDLRQMEVCENEKSDHGAVMEMDDEDQQNSHGEQNPESETMSPYGADVQEEHVESMNEHEDIECTEETCTAEEEEQEQEPGVDLKEDDVECEDTEMKRNDAKPGKIDTDDKKNEDNNVMEMEMEQQTENISKMEDLEERECSEQYEEPIVGEVKEENQQDGVFGTVVSEVENVTIGRSAGSPVDIGDVVELQLPDDDDDDDDDVEAFVNVVSVEAKAESPFEEASQSSSQDTCERLNKTENDDDQDLKKWPTELPAPTPEHSVHPEAEENTAPATSASPVVQVKVKDEPLDEEYEKALGPQTAAEKIKEEPETSEEFVQKTSEQIKISSVFSVNGSSTASGSPAAPPAANPAPYTASVSSPSASSALCVVCSGCKKILLKGQTAFQRKGSSQLYCSPRCLCSSTSTESVNLIIPSPKKTCHYCFKIITNLKDVIIAPVDSVKTLKDFCSQKCLSAFNYKRANAKTSLATKCSVCQNPCTIRHEVNFVGSVHKLCSDGCFQVFRSSNKIGMNSCVSCGGYCYSSNGKSSTLLIDNTVKKFCSQNCVSTFKKKYSMGVPCAMCRSYRTITDMMESVNSEGNTELFCSSSCVTAHKVQVVSASGSALECNQCKKLQMPQYHLAMSDGSIRNFCCFTCVVSFQDAFNKRSNPSGQLNVVPSAGSAQSNSAPTTPSPASAESSSPNVTQPSSVSKFTCVQCKELFSSRPELLEFKGKMYVFCGKSCTDEFSRTHYIMAKCVYCKIEKVVKELKKINSMDRAFCSEGCKLLYKNDLAKRWGKKHCSKCFYCGRTSPSVILSQFSGKQEEFCGNECLSQYTLLFCEVAKCNMCKQAGKMTETVKWLHGLKHFCNLKCLMEFCSLNTCTVVPPVTVAKPAVTQASTVPVSVASATQSAVTVKTTLPSPSPKDATPVIANVMSLSNSTNRQHGVIGSVPLQGTVPPVVKLIEHASTQTDTVKPPSAPPRILKNKSLLCKPLTQSKGTSCKPNTSDSNTQTDESPPKVIVVPLPVPVFVPMPMNLYTQYTPHPVGLPFPMPVPLFLPTTLDSAEQIVETIQKIKEKIPDNPLEADLIMMAEMVAEDSEKDKAVSQGDQDENFIEDFDLDALSSWGDDSVSSASRWGRSSDTEKVAPARPEQQSPSPTRPEPQMDLEADFPVAESLEQHAQEDLSGTTSRPNTRKRKRECLSMKKRVSKRSTEAPQSSAAEVPHLNKLQTEYGVQAWKSWVRWRGTQPNMEIPKFGLMNIEIKEDLLQCTTAELSYGLCKFITEVRRPNGDTYHPDSIYYLCLGIQQHLFENGRMENIFADLLYTKFGQIMHSLLKDWKPAILPSGYVHSRVEEEYLWNSKQLGAFSPNVLLNTLLYFSTKFFNFKTVSQHRRLSFAHFMRCSRTESDGSKTSCLRYFPPVPKENASNDDVDSVPAKKKKGDEEEDGVLEMQENAENPLRCPVRLHEFYTSKCSESVKQLTSVFYLRPERSCVPNSPLWFSHVSLDDGELETMLARILTVREVHVERENPHVSEPENRTDSE